MSFEMKRIQQRLDKLEKDSKGIEIMRLVLLEVNETLIDIKQRLLQLEINQKGHQKSHQPQIASLLSI